jgi:hypothetical protein
MLNTEWAVEDCSKQEMGFYPAIRLQASILQAVAMILPLIKRTLKAMAVLNLCFFSMFLLSELYLLFS